MRKNDVFFCWGFWKKFKGGKQPVETQTLTQTLSYIVAALAVVAMVSSIVALRAAVDLNKTINRYLKTKK